MNRDSELLARCRQGEAAAWDELFDAHYDPACRFVFQLAPDFCREDAEEIVQEAFLSVVRSLDSFQGQSAFQTWFFRIAANKAGDFREKRTAAKRGGGQRVLSLQAEDPETGLTLDPPSKAAAPDAALSQTEDAALVHQALVHLGQPCRELLELRYFGDLSYDEIAAALSLNSKTVSSRLSRCLDRLEEMGRTLFAGGSGKVFPSNS